MFPKDREKHGFDHHDPDDGEYADDPGAWDGDEDPIDLIRDPEAHLLDYCYTCGSPWPETEILCPACGATDKARGTARPTVAISHDTLTFDGPWKLLPWPPTGSVAIFGGPGAGKSSLAAMIKPTCWLTKEQEPRPVGDMFRRLLGDTYMPQVHAVETPEDVHRVLNLLDRGPVVVDSLTAFGLKDALVIAHILVTWARRRGDRALGIVQVTKDGSLAGYNQIPHLFDAVVNVQPDPWGVRAFRVTKSRWSAIGALYWKFSADGTVTLPDFHSAYTVEGEPGSYWLHPFPLKGSKWGGLCRSLAEAGALEPGSASAAVQAPYMPEGFIEPSDSAERQAFAEQNGLTWVSPNDLPTPTEAEE